MEILIPKSGEITVLQDHSEELFRWCESELGVCLSSTAAYSDRAAFVLSLIRDQRLYLLARDEDGNPKYTSMRQYLMDVVSRMPTARSTLFQYMRVMRLLTGGLHRPPEDVLEVGIKPLLHLESLVEFDHATGKVRNLTPEAERLLPPGDDPVARVNAAVDEFAALQQAHGSRLPPAEAARFFREDYGGQARVSMLVRILPDGRADWGWLFEGIIGWSSETPPPTAVLTSFLKRTGAVLYE